MFYTTLILLSSLCFASEGMPIEQKIDLNRVESLTVSDGYYITLSQGKAGITLSGHPDAIDAINIDKDSHAIALSYQPKKKSGWLSSFLQQKNYNTNHYALKINISLPHLESIHLHGTAQASIKDDLGIEKIELSGASQLDISTPITARDLDIELRGVSFLSTKGIKANQLMLQQSGTTRSIFSDLKVRQYGIFNISGKASLQALMINAPQLKLEGSGTSLYNINTLKSDQLTIELYGISSADVRSLKTDLLQTFLHESSALKVKNAEVKKQHEHHTGVATAQYGYLKKR